MPLTKVTVHVFVLAVLLSVLASGVAAQTTYVYVGNYNGNSVSAYSVNPGTGLLSPVPGSPFATGINPVFVSLDHNCRFAYVPNIISNNVSAYVIDTNTGSLTQVPGSPFSVGLNPDYSGIDQFGKFLYVPNQGPGNGSFSAFTINGDNGVLTPVSGSPLPTGGVIPTVATVDPSNRFLYISNTLSGDVSGFAINPNTGIPSPISGSPWKTGGTRPIFVKTDNTGRFLYVSNRTSITTFSIEQDTGALAQISGSPVTVGSDLYYIKIDAANKFAYVGDNGGGVYGFSIDSITGQLTPLAGFPVFTEAPQGNSTFATDPTREFLYVANQDTNTIGVWRIDSNSGALTQIPGSPFTTGSTPSSVATCTAPDADGAVARLFGGNNFLGDQMVNGEVMASFFVGDGSRLTNFNPANIGPGTAQINISGVAASALNANNAANAANLGGIPASSFARLDVGNSLNGNQVVTGNVSVSGSLSSAGTTSIGGGTPIVEHLSMTFNPSLPALRARTCANAAFAFPGASDGDTLALGVPNARTTGGDILYFAWVNAADSVMIRACNISVTSQSGPGSGTIRVDLWKH